MRRNEKKKAVVDIYDELYEFLTEVLNAAKTEQKFSIDRGVELIAKVIDTPSAIESLYRKAIYRKEFKYDSNVHGINVAIFAIKIGEGLGYKRDQLVELGIAALIHDIGMCKIPDEVVNKEGVLTNEQYALIKKHPQFGYDIIFNALGEKYKWLAEVVSQEQEREGGQGYPRGLLGNEIHEYAKVIDMVDVYEALSHPRPQRKRFLPYESTKVMVDSSKNMFPRKLIKALLMKLSCFPTGSYVVLHSKAIGRVVETNEAYPLRPVIEMLYDSVGKKLTEKKIVKLQDTPFLYITDSMYEKYWGLNELPFENVPDPRFMYHSTQHEEALRRLLYATKAQKGAAMLSGEVGCGKTTVSRAFVQELSSEEYEIGIIANPSLTALDFLKEIVYQLCIEKTADSKPELLHILNEAILQNLNKKKKQSSL